MRNEGEQRPRWAARRALALLPIPDGFDGHAKLCREFLLRQACAAPKVAHYRGTGFRRRRRGHRRLQRELLPVPQFDDPSVRLQPQALHDPARFERDPGRKTGPRSC
jgi:hypothetical protein